MAASGLLEGELVENWGWGSKTPKLNTEGIRLTIYCQSHFLSKLMRLGHGLTYG